MTFPELKGLGLRKKIQEKFMEEPPETTQTPVTPFEFRRRTRLLVTVVPVVLWGIALLLWAQEDLDRMILVAHNALRLQTDVVTVFRLISEYGMPCMLPTGFAAGSARSGWMGW